MSVNYDNNNYFEALSPTGRDIQGIIPVKKYYVIKQPFKQPINTLINDIPIGYREGVNDHSNQVIYLQIVRTGGGLLQPFIKNATNSDLSYLAVINQQFNNTIQQKEYYQRDSNYTTVKADTTAQNSFLKLQSFGTSTNSNDSGNDKGSFNLNIKINNHNLNIIGNWYTPLVNNINSQDNDNLNGWITLETVDNYLDLI